MTLKSSENNFIVRIDGMELEVAGATLELPLFASSYSQEIVCVD